MKYCVDYKHGFKYIKEINELNINYNPKDTSLEQFLLNYKDKRINIYIKDEPDFIINHREKLFGQLAEKHPDVDFALVIPGFKRSEKTEVMYNAIKDYPIRYFFFDMVTDWDTLLGYMDYHPSDMFIAEALGFELNKVAEILHKHNIRIRTYANVAQSSWKQTPALKKFFIRPDDVDRYEPYIDVIEFFGKENSKETLYRIYAKEKKWFGPLKEVILDFNSDIDSRYIIPIFAQKRLSCGRRCMKGKTCHVCEAIERLSETLEENDVIIKDEDI